MPKKFTGENSKSAVARARKNAVRLEKKTRDDAAKEDAYWADNDKHVQRKLQRKQEDEQKRQELLEKKLQNKQVYEEELKSLTTSNKASALSSNPVTKVTLAQIEMRRQVDLEQEKIKKELIEKKMTRIKIPDEKLAENLNRASLDDDFVSTVDDAIKVLGKATDDIEKHSKKNIKAAFAAFEERRLPELKKAHPTFRLSQIKLLLGKEWLKSVENPLIYIYKK